MSDRIRAERQARGWSQAELAGHAGVTRQLVGALEAGRHTPNVAAALGLAAALECTVEDLFGRPPVEVRSVLGGPLVAGSPVATVRVGEHLSVVPLADVVATTEAWAVADARCTATGVERLPGGAGDGVMIVGCDPLLGLVGGLMARGSGHRLVTVHGSSAEAVDALRAGRVHGALVHGPANQLPDPPVPVRRWHVASWQVGLASRNRGGPPTVAEIVDRRPKIVRRAEGAASHAALVRAMHRCGGDGRVSGPIGRGHLDVARRVATSGPTTGVTMEPAAMALGLHFVPLEVHVVELWIDERWCGLPAIAAVVEILGGAMLASRGEILGGYDLVGAGQELTP